MIKIIQEAKTHIKHLLVHLRVMGGNFDGMIDAETFLDRLEKWESLKPAEQAKETEWIKIGTFDLEEFIEPDD